MAVDYAGTLSPSPVIAFGTDGWRGIIADDFTGANVRLVSQATANYLSPGDVPGDKIAIVGYDNRAQSEYFAGEAASVLAANGFRTILSATSCSSPLVSRSCHTFGAKGGIMITASHNPPSFNGLKIKMGYGGPALPEHIAEVEQELRALISAGKTNIQVPAPDRNRVERLDLREDYLNGLRAQVDLKRIAASGYKVVADSMYGSGSGYLSELLPGITEIRTERNPSFGGINPEPIPQNIDATREAVLSNKADVAVIIDGDADRIGAMDSTGAFVDSHRIFALVLRHMVEVKGLTGSVVKTVSGTMLIDRMCERYGLKLRVVPIGFKNICEWFMKEQVLMGGEESGGLCVSGYIPERDGPLLGLLLLETMAVRGQKLEEQIAGLMSEYGPHEYNRVDLRPSKERMPAIVAHLRESAPAEIAGCPVDRIDRMDGTKFYFSDGSWLLLRASGTEPVVRVYCESSTQDNVARLLDAGTKIVERA